MDADQTLAERVQELATLTQRLWSAEHGISGLSYSRSPDESWEPETPEQVASRNAEYDRLAHERDEARPALEALLAELHIETSDEIVAWAGALKAIPADVMTKVAERLLNQPGVDASVVLPALEDALGDESPAVRATAWEEIMRALGLADRQNGPEGSPGFTPVALWKEFLWSGLPTFANIGAEGMRQSIRLLRAGSTPESVGFVWAPCPANEVLWRLRLASGEWGAALPVEELAGLTGFYRYWAEAVIALRVEKMDERAPSALARLNARWTVSMLEACAARPETVRDMREQIAQSLCVLKESADAPANPASFAVP